MPIPSGLQIFKKREPFFTVSGNADWCSHCGSNMEIPQKIKNGSAFDPAIPLLGVYPKEPQTLIQRNISTPVFIAVSFTISKIWKQPKYPSVDEGIKYFTQWNTTWP